MESANEAHWNNGARAICGKHQTSMWLVRLLEKFGGSDWLPTSFLLPAHRASRGPGAPMPSSGRCVACAAASSPGPGYFTVASYSHKRPHSSLPLPLPLHPVTPAPHLPPPALTLHPLIVSYSDLPGQPFLNCFPPSLLRKPPLSTQPYLLCSPDRLLPNQSARPISSPISLASSCHTGSPSDERPGRHLHLAGFCSYNFSILAPLLCLALSDTHHPELDPSASCPSSSSLPTA
ncbi:hypothetical protein VDGL01_07439 [Verticillium dahliae]